MESAAQPPSGGCVLKPIISRKAFCVWIPAAFGRLCVETQRRRNNHRYPQPAAFGRLCVETASRNSSRLYISQPPSGGCVLKQRCRHAGCVKHCQPPSGGCVLKQEQRTARNKLKEPAAFGRLCVETGAYAPPLSNRGGQPPSGGCVLKLSSWN